MLLSVTPKIQIAFSLYYIRNLLSCQMKQGLENENGSVQMRQRKDPTFELIGAPDGAYHRYYLFIQV